MNLPVASYGLSQIKSWMVHSSKPNTQPYYAQKLHFVSCLSFVGFYFRLHPRSKLRGIRRSRINPSNKFLCIFLSAGLFYLSFPNGFSTFGYSLLIWITFVPLIFVFDHSTGRERTGWAFLWGIVSYGLMVHWLLSLNFLGFIAFVILLTVQVVIFSLLFIISLLRPMELRIRQQIASYFR